MTRSSNGVSSWAAARAFLDGRACSGAVFHLLNGRFDHALRREEVAAMPLAGGIMQHGYQCGMIWGATLAAGAQAYRRLGPGPRAEAVAILAGQRLVETFRVRNGHMNCLEITDTDDKSSAMKMIGHFLLAGGTVRCFRMAARYVGPAFGEIETALAEDDIEPPTATVGCAAVLAKRMGMSDLHTIMAAGLAGGIGLCGGACGALGAAIWMQGLQHLDRGDGKLEFKDRRGMETVHEFLKCTKYEFECSEIVGRRFESLEDHADYVRSGGCSAILSTLARC